MAMASAKARQSALVNCRSTRLLPVASESRSAAPPRSARMPWA